MPHTKGVLSQSVLCPFTISQTCPMSFLKLSQECVPGRTCPGHVPDMYRTCPQNVPVLTILGHLQQCPESICPMSFLNFSNLAYVLSQTCPKMCPQPDMSRTRPGHVPDVSSKFPCPDHFGTSPNRTSATKLAKYLPQTSMKGESAMSNNWNVCNEEFTNSDL